MNTKPKVVVIAGPNGAGKSTTAPEIVCRALGISEFVNADTVARGLSAFAPERAAMLAGRIVIERIRNLAADRHDFAFETTLASLSFARMLRRMQADGYEVHLVFLWLPSAKMAAERVHERVRSGGHDIPANVIARR